MVKIEIELTKDEFELLMMALRYEALFRDYNDLANSIMKKINECLKKQTESGENEKD